MSAYFEDHPGLLNLAIILGVVLVCSFLYFIVFNWVARRLEASGTFPKQVRIKKLRLPFYLLLLSIALKIVFTSVDLHYQFMDNVHHITTIVIIMASAFMLVGILNVVAGFIMIRYEIREGNNLQSRKVQTQFRVLRRIIVFVIMIVAFGAALMTFNRVREIGVSLLASAGLAGVIVGFAAQKMIATMIAGFQIAITQPIRIDDVVIVEGEWGRIEEIRLTYVVIHLWDERRLIVPSTYFIEKPFQNWTRVTADIVGTVFIHVDYTVPLYAIRKELSRILETAEAWDGRVNVIQVTDTTEKTVELRALVSAPDSSKAWQLRVYVREKLIEFLQKNYPEALPVSRVSIDDKSKGTHVRGQRDI